MKIGFTCHMIFDSGDRKMEPSVDEALAELSRGNLNVEKVQLWLNEPHVILTYKDEMPKLPNKRRTDR